MANQTCGEATYDVTVDVDLGTYNVSVDEDGITAYTVTGAGGTFSTATLTGTGITQVTISNIPAADPWSINVNDVSGISCGLTGTNGTCASVLPVELISFTGAAKGNYNELSWVTATEINNDYFSIEKSDDGINFNALEGIVPGAGNSSQEISYKKNDENPFKRTYYRLKQVDFNGEYSYSKVIFLENKGNNIAEMAVYPNPAINMITLNFNSGQEDATQIEITNALGQQVVEKAIKTKIGLNTQVFDLVDLPNGVYFVTVKANDKMSSKKILKH